MNTKSGKKRPESNQAALPRTDLKKFCRDVCHDSYKKAFPTALSDKWLVLLGRDLRALADSIDNPSEEKDDSAYLACPMYAVFFMLKGRVQELKTASNFSIEKDDLMELIGVYHDCIHLELASRSVGQKGQHNDAEWIEALDAAALKILQ